MKKLFIAEKPSVAKEFAKTLGEGAKNMSGYIEGEHSIFTWCVGHLVAMSYPDKYDATLKKWNLSTLPFLPDTYRYEVISTVKKQFDTVSSLLHRKDIEAVYVCTDSGREGEYIYRLIEELSGIPKTIRKRVWIDSQTTEEILRGVREAKDLSFYDALSDSAYLRAKEDYLMGINFSRVLTLTYSNYLAQAVDKKWIVIAVGRVMTCVLGMVVQREREIRSFVKIPFYKLVANVGSMATGGKFNAEFKCVKGSKYYNSPLLYKDIGLLDKNTANEFAEKLSKADIATVIKATKKVEKKAAPLCYNLSELQNDCSKQFKISPDETLNIVQELYEKKLVTYPRTDARVLSTAISKEIHNNLRGILDFARCSSIAKHILDNGLYKNLYKTKYVDDSKITDHYAIIPTGSGFSFFSRLPILSQKVYGKIILRFLSIFLPPAKYESFKIFLDIDGEQFVAGVKSLKDKGYLELVGVPASDNLSLPSLKAKDVLKLNEVTVKDGETTPPKRYTTGSIILAMENAGNLIEDEELRAQIKGSGIGTSATRAEIIKKLNTNQYIKYNKKQIITPTYIGECIYQVVGLTIPGLLNPKLTASWEKGLDMVANGDIAKEEYMSKLENFVKNKVEIVKHDGLNYNIIRDFAKIKIYYGL